MSEQRPPVYRPRCGHTYCAPTVCRFENTEPKTPDTHDFRDYPQPDRPDLDLDAFGRPLKPGT